jgi:hypothetical protein
MLQFDKGSQYDCEGRGATNGLDRINDMLCTSEQANIKLAVKSIDKLNASSFHSW